MQWELSGRLGGPPLVLASPVLRTVMPKSVTVWVALKTAASVKLTIKDESGAALENGTLATIAVGQNLHIVSVTAKPDGKDLTEGVVYQLRSRLNHRISVLESQQESPGCNQLRADYLRVEHTPDFCAPAQGPQ